MTIELFKQLVEQKQDISDLVVLKYDKDPFLADHYLQRILRYSEYEFISELTPFLKKSNNIFGEAQDILYIHRCDSLNEIATPALLNRKILIICKSFASKDVENSFGEHVIQLPKLEDWQIKDFAYSLIKGVPEEQIDRLLSLCKNDYYRLEQELSKISIFEEPGRKFLFEDFVRDGALSDLSTYNIFNFTNAISRKDINTIASVYKEKDYCDITEMNLLVILCQAFRNTILVQTANNPTEQSIGISNKQIWAVRNNNCGFYDNKELTKIYEFLTGIDYKIKNGEMPMEILIDYLMVKILFTE